MPIRKKALIASAAPIVLGACASLLFASQGGVGAGHGRFDRAIALLGLPATAVTPSLFAGGDFTAWIVVPALANALLWYLAATVVLRVARTDARAN